jgi:cardiolipin synthase
MKKNYAGMVVFLAIATFSFLLINRRVNISLAPKITAPNGDLSLITEPDAGIAPILALINEASTSLDLVMYELEDKQAEGALVADEKRGVAVRVLISAGYKGESFSANQPAYDFLRANGVPVEWTQSYFALTHEKSLVVDHSTALIMTFNMTSQYYSTSRDFGVVDTDANDIVAMEQTFNNDWRGNDVAANDGDDLIWSPGSEPVIVALINNAQKTLDIYNEEMADPRIIKALIDAAQRGVVVNIDMTYSSEYKKAFEELITAGAHVRTYDENAPLYIHAKMIIADGSQAFVGSENFSENSLDDNRELGIIVTDPNSIVSLTTTFNSDWKGATVFSL